MKMTTATTETTSSYWLLLQLTIRAKHGLGDLMERHGLTGMQAHVIGLLEPGVARPMNTLSEQLGCDASNVTGLVDRLEGHGVIERQNNPDDRRLKMIILTKKGEGLRGEIMADLAAIERKYLAPLSVSEQTTLNDLLSKLVL